MKSWAQRERALETLSKEIGYVRKPHGDRKNTNCEGNQDTTNC